METSFRDCNKYICIIEDNPEDLFVLKELLKKLNTLSFQLQCYTNLNDALDASKVQLPEIVLLDISLPDSEGLETFSKLYAHLPETPIVVLSGEETKELSLEAIRCGAQDFLIKKHLNTYVLEKAILFSIERNLIQTKMKGASFNDELTKIFNRRGFFFAGEEVYKQHKRYRRSFLLLYFDLDNLKKINDSHGHEVGDSLLISFARLLKITFRNSDIIGRIGGDEFVVIAAEAKKDVLSSILNRLEENLKAYNAKKEDKKRLLISCGYSTYEYGDTSLLHDLVQAADQSMYLNKKENKARRNEF